MLPKANAWFNPAQKLVPGQEHGPPWQKKRQSRLPIFSWRKLRQS